MIRANLRTEPAIAHEEFVADQAVIDWNAHDRWQMSGPTGQDPKTFAGIGEAERLAQVVVRGRPHRRIQITHNDQWMCSTLGEGCDLHQLLVAR